MSSEPYLIPGPWSGKLAIASRPRGGDWLEDDLARLRQHGIGLLVSLLTRDEETELDLTDESTVAKRVGMRYVSFPVVDRSIPASASEAVGLLTTLYCSLNAGESVAVHCRQGIGRSALIAAGLLVLAGEQPGSAMKTVSAARGLPTPETAHQKDWIERTLTDHLALAKTGR